MRRHGSRMTATIRILRILAYCHGRRGWISLDSLAAEMGVCTRTIRRDFDVLREIGVDVDWRGKLGQERSVFRFRWVPIQIEELIRKVA